MASIPLVALSSQTQQPSPLDQYSKLVSLKGAMQGQQLQSQQIQENQDAIQSRQAVRAAYQQAIKPGANGQPEIDTDKLSSVLSSNGHGDAIPSILENVNKYQKTKQDLVEQAQKIQTAQADGIGHAAKAVQDAKYDPNVAHTILDTMPSSPQIQQMRQLIDSNPDVFKQKVDAAVSASPALQKMQNETDIAKIRAAGKPAEGELPLADKVPQINQALASRFQVLNPGKPLPPQFTLPPTATQKDFDRVDKLMQQTEQAQGTKAQQDTANSMRQQTAEMAKQNQQDRIDKQGIEPVVGTDKSGNSVLVSMADAKNMGLTGTMKADADLVNKSQAARDWLKLADKKGETPETMGIRQLVDKMDKEGKIGPIASRWNEFLAGKVGEGDAEYSALRAKMGLSTTKLMQAHVGSRGGAFMLEHFEDLANAKKMDATTLKAGINSELNYMQDVAKLPGAANATPNKAGGTKILSPAEWLAQQKQKPNG
jgi:hypothetical protein